VTYVRNSWCCCSGWDVRCLWSRSCSGPTCSGTPGREGRRKERRQKRREKSCLTETIHLTFKSIQVRHENIQIGYNIAAFKEGILVCGGKNTIFCWMGRNTFSLNLLLSPSASIIAISDDALGDFILCFKMWNFNHLRQKTRIKQEVFLFLI